MPVSTAATAQIHRPRAPRGETGGGRNPRYGTEPAVVEDSFGCLRQPSRRSTCAKAARCLGVYVQGAWSWRRLVSLPFKVYGSYEWEFAPTTVVNPYSHRKQFELVCVVVDAIQDMGLSLLLFAVASVAAGSCRRSVRPQSSGWDRVPRRLVLVVGYTRHNSFCSACHNPYYHIKTAIHLQAVDTTTHPLNRRPFAKAP